MGLEALGALTSAGGSFLGAKGQAKAAKQFEQQQGQLLSQQRAQQEALNAEIERERALQTALQQQQSADFSTLAQTFSPSAQQALGTELTQGITERFESAIPRASVALPISGSAPSIVERAVEEGSLRAAEAAAQQAGARGRLGGLSQLLSNNLLGLSRGEEVRSGRNIESLLAGQRAASARGQGETIADITARRIGIAGDIAAARAAPSQQLAQGLSGLGNALFLGGITGGFGRGVPAPGAPIPVPNPRRIR